MSESMREMLEEIERINVIEKERLSNLTKKEKIEEELFQAREDYNACAMVGNFEGMEDCEKDIEKLTKELEREAE